MGASSSTPSSGLVETGSAYVLRHPLCKFVTPIRTAIGLITVFGCFIVVTAFLYLMKPLQMKKTPTFIVDSTTQARGNAAAQVADPTVYGS
uniref:Movement protein n=2 Tax=Ascaris lumbricoides TaxID=6252 RepID=A0A0M3ILS5_ASCLU